MSVPWTMPYRIETERAVLRPYDEADVPVLTWVALALAGAPDVVTAHALSGSVG